MELSGGIGAGSKGWFALILFLNHSAAIVLCRPLLFYVLVFVVNLGSFLFSLFNDLFCSNRSIFLVLRGALPVTSERHYFFYISLYTVGPVVRELNICLHGVGLF